MIIRAICFSCTSLSCITAASSRCPSPPLPLWMVKCISGSLESIVGHAVVYLGGLRAIVYWITWALDFFVFGTNECLHELFAPPPPSLCALNSPVLWTCFPKSIIIEPPGAMTACECVKRSSLFVCIFFRFLFMGSVVVAPLPCCIQDVTQEAPLSSMPRVWGLTLLVYEAFSY